MHRLPPIPSCHSAPGRRGAAGPAVPEGWDMAGALFWAQPALKVTGSRLEWGDAAFSAWLFLRDRGWRSQPAQTPSFASFAICLGLAGALLFSLGAACLSFPLAAHAGHLRPGGPTSRPAAAVLALVDAQEGRGGRVAVCWPEMPGLLRAGPRSSLSRAVGTPLSPCPGSRVPAASGDCVRGLPSAGCHAEGLSGSGTQSLEGGLPQLA